MLAIFEGALNSQYWEDGGIATKSNCKCWKFFVFCFQAVQCQQEKCVAILLEHGADPNLADADGNTALHLAVLSGNATVAGLLLQHNANIDAQNKVNFIFVNEVLFKSCIYLFLKVLFGWVFLFFVF